MNLRYPTNRSIRGKKEFDRCCYIPLALVPSRVGDYQSICPTLLMAIGVTCPNIDRWCSKSRFYLDLN